MKQLFAGLCALPSLLACSSSTDLAASLAPSRCEGDAECGGGTCDAELGACVASRGELDALLFEITPSTSDAGFGGLSIFSSVSGLASSEDELNLNIEHPVLVQGEVVAHGAQAGCTGDAKSTLPVDLEFRPAAWVWGLKVPTYFARTQPTDFEYRFENLAIPAGTYDVYVRPIATGAPETVGCEVVPQLFRGVEIAQEESVNVHLEQSAPVELTVRVGFEDRLEGWALDVIHPKGGERISNRVILEGADSFLDTEGLAVEAALRYSVVAGTDFVAPDYQLVRLTPPAGVIEPTIYFFRSGLEVFSPGEARIGAFQSFEPVTFRAWVWEDGKPDAVVPATAHFVATELKGVSDGVVVGFEATAETGPDGELEVDLLPGTYRVRTVPKDVSRGVSAIESYVTVREPEGEGASRVQAGQVIALLPAAKITGQVLQPNEAPAVGASVDALAASVQTACLAAGGMAEQECGVLLPDVLQSALAQESFRPRSSTGLVSTLGDFELPAVDCRGCTTESGALVDVFVRPVASSGHAWRFFRGVPVGTDVSLGTIKLEPAVVQRGMLTFGEGAPFPGALIRVYALLDARGQYIEAPLGLPDCARAAGEPLAERCVASAFQVAEVRVDSTGHFVLPLPATFR